MAAYAPDFDVVIIGAGVIGLSAAMAAGKLGHKVLILERNASYGQETSARNSEVVHAGIYYEPQSLKARMCVAGRHRLYEFAAENGVPFRQCGKLIVANAEYQLAALEAIAVRGETCGVSDIQFVNRSELVTIEPQLKGIGALISPSTGIIDSHAYMTALLGHAESLDAQFVAGCQVSGIKSAGNSWQIFTTDDAEESVTTRAVINCAGLWASEVAAMVEGLPGGCIPSTRYAKGSYFSYSANVPFSHLIYPLPEPGGLGIHLTLDLAGRARFGPDVTWIKSLEYDVNISSRDRFADAVAKFWPEVDRSRMFPDYAGVRPKLSGPAEAGADFVVSGPAHHGLDGLVNLFGIESPGLTSSLPLGEMAADLACTHF
ncbi:FAD-dependent oxidoreductase [Altererythrobacter confluentis]|uniref:FAD-dependent oxidoreductase n=1 Tax=Allopontixanthobacter confluentis TaxID=1849021 RepID=A0A6L7GHZ9_9SPHN|nr:NAD(P)/FAD-dependent oxidoreductase [Allopontixanthobacter confluentis]MXP15165.1 FAD-dependent oxidoreductase [Allopontixanthobacter confluentis]